jgi:hypothetical protein
MGSYKVTPDGLPAGGRTGQAIGGTYTEINERKAATKVARMERLAAQAPQRGLSADEIAEIEKAYKNLPREARGSATGTFGSERGSAPADLFNFAQMSQDMAGIIRKVLGKGKAARELTPEPFTPQQVQDLTALIENNLVPRMNDVKMAANQFGVSARNFALLDYGRRTQLDDWMAYAFPYGFWYKGTYLRWPLRFAQNPTLLGNFARYKQLVREADVAYYRQMTGDPNAEPPENWNRGIRVPGTEYFIDAERYMSPLSALTEDFTTANRRAAPGGPTMEVLNSMGPSIWSHFVWAYAFWLLKQGKDEAAQEWAGNILPQSPAIQGLTALAREKIPGAENVIPAGGTSPEMLLAETGAWPFAKGGTIWFRKTVGSFLKQLLDAGKITPEAYQEAAYKQTGDAWERARQMAALAQAPGWLLSFVGGPGLKPRGKLQTDIQYMWDKMGEIYDQKAQLTADGWERAWSRFDEQFPWASAFRMSRRLDPNDRLYDYSWLVRDRLPPGYQNSEMLTKAGLTDTMRDKLYSSRNFDDWTPQELDAMRAVFEKLGAEVKVPSLDKLAEYEAAKLENDRINAEVIRRMNAEGLRFSLDDMLQMQDDFYAAGGKGTPLKPLSRFWDIRRELRQASTLGRKYYISPASAASTAKYQAGQNIWEDLKPPGSNWDQGLDVPPLVQDFLYNKAKRDAMSAAQINQVQAWLSANVPADYRNPAEWAQARALEETYTAAVKEKFAPDIEKWAAERASLPDAAAKAQWDKAFPARKEALKGYWDFKREFGNRNPIWGKYYGFAADTGASASTGYLPTIGGGRRERRTFYGGSNAGRRTTTATTAPAELSGADEMVLAVTTEEVNALAQTVRQSMANFDTEVTRLFGADILTLVNSFLSMDAATRAAYRRSKYALYQRILLYLMWLLARGTGSV